jgi:hypothetical protein
VIAKHAHLFSSGIGQLTEANMACAASISDGNRDKPVLPVVQQWIDDAIAQLRRAYVLSDVWDPTEALDRLERVTRPGGPTPPSASRVGTELQAYLSGVYSILSNEFYFHVDGSDVPLYMASEPFGASVSKKFPKAIEDISEAAKCLAFQRCTASVFHLMRVMEIGVRTLGRKLKVSVDVENETWYQIMEHVDGAIRKLPAQTANNKRRKAELAAISANLNAVRIAQRNEVMHPKQTYTREEAHAVYRATKAFMDHLAGQV